MIRAVAAALIVAVIGPRFPVRAQEGPTDNDVKAAYCLRVTQDELAELRPCQEAALDANSSVPAMRQGAQLFQQVCDDYQSRAKQLRDYLKARGYLVGAADPSPIIVAMQYGETDSRACKAESLKPNSGALSCLKKCPFTSQGIAPACYDACPVIDACRRVVGCQDIGFLPSNPHAAGPP